MGTTESVPYDDQQPNSSDVAQSVSVNGSPVLGKRISDPSKANQEGQKKPNRPLTRMSAVIVGGPKVGKRTLIQRLVGIDPYDPNANKDQVPPVVTTPYYPPPGMPTWNRIQLQVGRIQSDAEQMPTVDFVMLLIRPSHKNVIEDLKSEIQHVINSHLFHLEYSAATSKTKDSSAGSCNDDSAPQSPVCICVMINFRDQIPEESVPKVEELQTTIDEFVHGVLKQYSIPKDRLLVQLLSTSLRNCFGLDRLNFFIYRTYLQKKREALEAQLRAVTNQIQRTGEPDFVAYGDFCKLLNPRAIRKEKPAAVVSSAVSSTSTSRPQSFPQHDPAESESRQSNSKPVNDSNPRAGEKPRPRVPQSHPPRKKTQENEEMTANGKTPSNRPSQIDRSRPPSEAQRRRRLIPPPKQQVRVGKDALEAFLASDSSDEGRPPAKTKPRAKSRFKSSAMDSSSDDDDDFFYDERGNFNNVIANGDNDSSSSSSDDEHIIKQQPMKAPSIQATKPAERKLPKTAECVTQVQLTKAAHPPLNSNDVSSKAADKAATQTSSNDLAPSAPKNSVDQKPKVAARGQNSLPKKSPPEPSKDSQNHDASKKEPAPTTNRKVPNSATVENDDSSDDDDDCIVQEQRADDSNTDDENHRVSNRTDASLKGNGIAPGLESNTGERQENGAPEDDFLGGGDSLHESSPLTVTAPSADSDSEDDEFFVSEESRSQEKPPASANEMRSTYQAAKDDDDSFHEKDQPVKVPGTSNHSDNSDDEEVIVDEPDRRPVESRSVDVPVVPSTGQVPSEPAATDDESDADQSARRRHVSVGAAETLSTMSSADDDSDDDFFVSGETNNTQVSVTSADTMGSKLSKAPVKSVEPKRTLSAANSITGVTSAPNSGISAAALAAIQAAQREAEAMLQQPNSNIPMGDDRASKPKKAKKEKKAKKDGEKKKKTKKDKTKSRSSVENSSD